MTVQKCDSPNVPVCSSEAYSTWETAIEKLAELGFEYLPDDFPPPDEWVRVPSAFKDSKNRSAAVMITADGKTVQLYDHIEGCCHTIHGKSIKSLSAMEKRRLQEERRQKQIAAAIERRKRTEEGIESARDLFEKATPCSSHAYLKRKNVVLPGCRTDGYWLLVPLTDTYGRLQSLQRIAPDGSKRLAAGAPLMGSAYRIGNIEESDTVYISEGAATGGSVYEERGSAVICSMAAFNLEKSAQDIRTKYPDIKIVIAGDDDQKSIKNMGREKAIAAAEAVSGFVLLPSFCESCNGRCTDHNDVATCKRNK